jgi:hypothetical protein
MMKKAYVYFCIVLALNVVGCDSGTVNPVDVKVPEETVLTRADVKEDVVKDGRDGESYRTVKIGEQWWMAENLRYAADSSLCYNDEEYFCKAYGRLYPWVVAMNLDTIYRRSGAIYDDVVDSLHQGVCPEGWHVPTKTEWETMIDFVKAHTVRKVTAQACVLRKCGLNLVKVRPRSRIRTGSVFLFFRRECIRTQRLATMPIFIPNLQGMRIFGQRLK